MSLGRVVGGRGREGEDRMKWSRKKEGKTKEVVVILIIIMKLVSRKKTWKRSAVLSFAYT